MDYVRDTGRLPTFAAIDDQELIGFLTLKEHFPEAWEVHCIAVRSEQRGRGVGRALHTHVEQWLATRGVRLLQVKTIAASRPSPEYAETRRFYSRIGYLPLEVFHDL